MILSPLSLNSTSLMLFLNLVQNFLRRVNFNITLSSANENEDVGKYFEKKVQKVRKKGRYFVLAQGYYHENVLYNLMNYYRPR